MAKLVVGCGYLGRRVAKLWCQQGDEVFAVTRSTARAQEFQSQGLRPVLGDVTGPFVLPPLPPLEAVLFAVGMDRSTGCSIREVYVDGLQRVLETLPETTERIVYISSTGVYGQTDGERIDEDSPCQPLREAGRACLAAERLLDEHPLGERAIVLRLAGIYGPQRIPKMAEIQAGRPVEVDPDAYLNLIHVNDAAAVVEAAARLARTPTRYVVADGHPVRRRDFYGELAALLQAPPPVFVPPDIANAGRGEPRRGAGDKRIDPARMTADLKTRLQYPTFREGLLAIVQTGEASGI